MSSPAAFTCRLASRAVAAGKRVHIRAASDALEALDGLLWEYLDRFIPHARLAPDAPAPAEAVLLGDPSEQPRHREVLINLAADTPDFLAGFERASEVVLAADRAAGRAKYQVIAKRPSTV